VRSDPKHRHYVHRSSI
jgi:ribonuclease HI